MYRKAARCDMVFFYYITIKEKVYRGILKQLEDGKWQKYRKFP